MVHIQVGKLGLRLNTLDMGMGMGMGVGVREFSMTPSFFAGERVGMRADFAWRTDHFAAASHCPPRLENWAIPHMSQLMQRLQTNAMPKQPLPLRLMRVQNRVERQVPADFVPVIVSDFFGNQGYAQV